MKKSIYLLLGYLLVISLTFFLGCTGEDGPPGKDAVGVDSRSPMVSLVLPVPHDTIKGTMTAIANAIDNVGVQRVVFYINGSDQVNDSTAAWVYEAPAPGQYQFDFNLTELGLIPFEVNTITARAYDVAQNSAQTAPVIFYYGGPPDEGTVYLRNYNTSADTFMHWSIADSGVVDTTTEWTTRFIPSNACSLRAARVYLNELPGDPVAYKFAGFRVRAYESNGAYPTNILADTSYSESDLLAVIDTTQGWLELELPAVAIDAGEQFHLSLMVDDSASASAHMSIRAEPVQRYIVPIQNKSGLKDSTGSWKTLQEHFQFGTDTWEFWMEAKVEYPDNAEQVLKPAGLRVER